MLKIIVSGLSLGLLAGCTLSESAVLPDVVAYKSPTDPHSGIRPQHPRTVLAGYNRRRIIEPNTWKGRNAEPTSWRDQSVTPITVPEPQS